MKVHNMPIPKEKFDSFVELFNQANARYISKPYIQGDHIIVSFEREDNTDFDENWRRTTTPIVERKPDKIKTLIRRIKLKLSNLLNLLH